MAQNASLVSRDGVLLAFNPLGFRVALDHGIDEELPVVVRVLLHQLRLEGGDRIVLRGRLQDRHRVLVVTGDPARDDKSGHALVLVPS
jgi:hypothetical protein